MKLYCSHMCDQSVIVHIKPSLKQLDACSELRMQKMAVEYNKRIEIVIRERKFHQVTIRPTIYLNLRS
jgi:hypothetical protein